MDVNVRPTSSISVKYFNVLPLQAIAFRAGKYEPRFRTPMRTNTSIST